MTTNNEVTDFYEVLEVSQNANSYTIERVFRFLAKRFHPDVAESGDAVRFSQIVDAYETLRDPARRAAYDIELAGQQEKTSTLLEEASTADSDALDRHRLLTLFYAKRRRDSKTPGLGIATLEQAFDFPTEVLDFHLWYFREKKLIQREESGLLSITAEGVDKIEERTLQGMSASGNQKITDGQLRIPYQPGNSAAAANGVPSA